MISLDRSIPDYRPSEWNSFSDLLCKIQFYPRDLSQISLIFIFVNEALPVILHTVFSVIHWPTSYGRSYWWTTTVMTMRSTAMIKHAYD
ncbi:hypothetical protein NFI96_018130, partial [Prochilodus magdalenae]